MWSASGWLTVRPHLQYRSVIIAFIIVISYYCKPCLTSVHRWQGGVTMVNKVLVAMETLFCSNRLALV